MFDDKFLRVSRKNQLNDNDKALNVKLVARTSARGPRKSSARDSERGSEGSTQFEGGEALLGALANKLKSKVIIK